MDSEILIDSIEREIAQQKHGLVALLSIASISVWALAAFMSVGAL